MFNYIICEPLNPIKVEKGPVSASEFRALLAEFPWIEMLTTFETSSDADICFSPSLELIDTKSTHSLTITIVGPISDIEYYIHYKRPKVLQKSNWFALVKRVNNQYSTEKTGQSEQDVEDAFNALLDTNFETLESRWG